MKHQIPMFKFTLGQGQSIGPVPLRALWAQACQSSEVSVGRSQGAHPTDKPTYSLYAAQHLRDLQQVEMRLRKLLDGYNLRVSLIIIHKY